MKTLYIECNMGAAGDMLMSALCELIPDPDKFIEKMNRMGLPGVQFTREKTKKCGVEGTHISVKVHGHEEHEHHHDHCHEHDHHHDHHHDHDHCHEHDHHHEHDHCHEHHHHHEHHHAGMADIAAIIENLPVSGNVRENVKAVYELIARAESAVHGVDVDQIHFHEVGSLDAVADVTGVCLLMEMIGAEKVVVSPVHVGFGQVKCAHGVLPVPAPATAEILKGVPTYGGKVRGELCTPTGAALLKRFAHEFGEMPVMAVEKTGYGMGTKDFEWANCVRVMLGETRESGDAVIEICCNLDDMTGEAIGYAAEVLRNEGALDVYTIAIQMKKNRPGVMLCCLCREHEREKFAVLMLKHTTTIGVRYHRFERCVLDREIFIQDTPRGPVRMKRSYGFGIEKVKPEFDDIAGIR